MTHQRLVVRPATAADAADVAALQARSWQAAYRGVAPDEVLDALTERTWLDRWSEGLARPAQVGVHRLVSAGSPDAAPRAVAVCGPAERSTDVATGQLYVLYADPGSWGRGHGRALLRRVHELLAADGHDRAQLWVASANTAAIGFYEHHGWGADGATAREELAGAAFDVTRMVRRLTD